MAAFDNYGSISQQIAHQSVSGDVYNIIENAASSRWRSAEDSGTLSTKALDDAVLESLSFPEMTGRRRNIASPHHSTCEWILELEQYKNWRSDSSGLLWIKGKPGAGKSTLISYLYHHGDTQRYELGDGAICLEYFFNARGVPLEQTSLGMLRCLCNQLYQQCVTAREPLRQSYQAKQESVGNRERTWQWQQPEIESHFTSMVMATAKRQPVTIIIDTLDEADGQAAREIAKYFHDLNGLSVEQSAMLKTCISSRHYPIASSMPSIEIHVDQHNREDIVAYIRDYLQPMLRSSDDTFEDWEWVIQELVYKAKGVFQWVRLIVPLVHDWICEGDSPVQVREYLSQVPAELAQMYEYILERVISPRHRPKSLWLFQWACLTARPLLISELEDVSTVCDLAIPRMTDRFENLAKALSSFKKTMERYIISCSGGLLEVSDNEGNNRGPYVQPIHQSVNDFLPARGFSILRRLIRTSQGLHNVDARITEMDAERIIATSHSEMYWICLRFAVTKPDEELVSSEERHDPFYFHMDLRHDISYSESFLQYAGDHFLTHAKRAGSYRGKNLEQELALLRQTIPTFAVCRPFYYRLDWLTQGTTVLHVAAAAGLIDLAHHYGTQGGNVHAVDQYGCTALHIAAEHGHLRMAQELVKMGIGIGSKTKTGAMPLMAAANAGHLHVFMWLKQYTHDVVGHQPCLGSALIAAVSGGRRTIAEHCLAVGANVNHQGVYCVEILRGSSLWINEEEEGVDHDDYNYHADFAIPKGNFSHALQAAVQNEDDDMVQLLLDHGADIDLHGGTFGNALQAASYQGNEKLVRVLLANGASVHTQGGRFNSALQAACARGHSKIIRLLLNHGANVNIQGGFCGTALQAAASRADDVIVKLLLKKGADVHAQGGYHGTALHAAFARGRYTKIQLLLKHGADINVQGGCWGDVLQAAAFGQSAMAVEMLLRNGADVNRQGGIYGNALQAAVATRNQNREVLQLLLDHGADVNAQGGKYGNALQAACYHRQIPRVRILLDRGADENLQGGESSTVLRAAKAKRKLLQEFRFHNAI